MRINPQPSLRYLNQGLIIFVVCQAIEESAIALFKCRPVAASWNVDIEGQCLDLMPLWWSTVSHTTFEAYKAPSSARD